MVLWLNGITSAHVGSKHIYLMNGYVPFLGFEEIRVYLWCVYLFY